MPAVLVLIFCVVQANIRREDDPVADASTHDGGRHDHGAAARARGRGGAAPAQRRRGARAGHAKRRCSRRTRTSRRSRRRAPARRTDDGRGARASGFDGWLGTRADDDVLRALFGVMLTATVSVLALDYQTLERRGGRAARGRARRRRPASRRRPSRCRSRRRQGPPRAAARSPMRSCSKPMTFDLQADGRLIATGTIMPGTAKAFADEVEQARRLRQDRGAAFARRLAAAMRWRWAG